MKWYKYEEQKPPEGVEVVAYSKDWIDEDFNPKGTRVGFQGGEDFISALWWDYMDKYVTISKFETNADPDFFENHIGKEDPEYWTYLPEFKKK